MRTIGIILIIGFALSGLEQLAANNGFEKTKQVVEIDELQIKAEAIRDQQIIDANIDAEKIIANATGSLKNCLNLPGHKLNGNEPYERVEACNIKEYGVEGTYFIKQKLKS